MKAMINSASHEIERVLLSHKVPARVTGGAVTPRWIRFEAVLAPEATTFNASKLSNELATALDVSDCDVEWRGAMVEIKVANDNARPVLLLPLYNQLSQDPKGVPAVSAILGIDDDDGIPLIIALSPQDVNNALVIGDKGAGKTSLLRAMATSLMLTSPRERFGFLFVGGDWEWNGTMDLIARMKFLVHGTTSLTQGILNAALSESQHLILVADNVKELGAIRTAVENKDVHCLVAWDGMPPTDVVDLFQAKIVGRVQGHGVYAIAGSYDVTQLEGKGDFIIIAYGETSRFQGAYVDPVGTDGMEGGELS